MQLHQHCRLLPARHGMARPDRPVYSCNQQQRQPVDRHQNAVIAVGRSSQFRRTRDFCVEAYRTSPANEIEGDGSAAAPGRPIAVKLSRDFSGRAPIRRPSGHGGLDNGTAARNAGRLRPDLQIRCRSAAQCRLRCCRPQASTLRKMPMRSSRWRGAQRRQRQPTCFSFSTSLNLPAEPGAETDRQSAGFIPGRLSFVCTATGTRNHPLRE